MPLTTTRFSAVNGVVVNSRVGARASKDGNAALLSSEEPEFERERGCMVMAERTVDEIWSERDVISFPKDIKSTRNLCLGPLFDHFCLWPRGRNVTVQAFSISI